MSERWESRIVQAACGLELDYAQPTDVEVIQALTNELLE
jgi:hypothetical protein